MKHKLFIFLFIGISFQCLAQRKSKKDKFVKSETYIQQEAEYYFVEGEKQFVLEDYTKAVTNFRSSLQLQPNNDVTYYKLAQIFNKTSQLEAAKEAISQAIQINPNNAFYYYLATDIHTNDGNLKEAANYYEQLLSHVPGEEKAYFQLGAIYLYLEAYDKALVAYQKAEQYFGINEQSTTQQQKIYLKLNQPLKAIEEGKKLHKAYPDNPKYVVMLAEMYSANGYNNKAIALIDSLLQANSEAQSVRLMLADLYRKEKKLDEFEQQLTLAFENPSIEIGAKVKTLTKYMALLPDARLQNLIPILADVLVATHPNQPDAILLQGDIYATLVEKKLIKENYISQYKQKAIDAYAKYIEQDPSKYNVWQTLLNYELQLNEYQQAIQHGEQALEVFPNQAWIYLVTGVAYTETSDPDKAIYYLQEGVKRASNNTPLLEMLYTYLGDISYASGYYEKSDKYYEKVLELNPNNELVLNNYSYYLSLREEHLEKAGKMATKLMRLNSGNAAYLDTYAWVQFKLGNYNEAKRVFEKIIKEKNPNAENYDHFGDVLYKIGLVEEAIQQWKKAKALDNTIKHINDKIEQGKIIQ